MRILSLVLIVITCIACTNEPTRSIPEKKTFVDLKYDHTGITFNNEVNESQTVNHFLWATIYTGGGVGICDINNDGLQDVFLTRTFGPDALYLNKGNMQFEDISAKAMIEGASDEVSAGIAFCDINKDGFKDIYVSKYGFSDDPNKRRNQLFINNGDLTFTEKSAEYGIDNPGYTVQSAFIDYDLDGDEDLYILNQPSNYRTTRQQYDNNESKWINESTSDRLLRNDGGKFTDVSSTAGVSNFAYGLGINISDVNNDGYPDVYIANDYDKPDYMYINNKKGGFENQIDGAVNHMSNFSMGMDISDINNDGLSDIAVLDMAGANHYRSKTNMPSMSPENFYAAVDKGYHYQYMHNTLQLNKGDNTYSDIAYLSGMAKTDWSWSLVIGDFDNDTYKDIYITNGIKKDIRNSDFSAKFEELASADANKRFSSTPLQLINMIPSTPMSNYMYHNDGQLHFENKAKEWGIDKKGFSNGCAYGDLDNDGDLDLVVNNMSSMSSILENQTAGTNHFLRIKLESNKNRSVLNTKAIVTLDNGTKLYNELSPVRGIMSSSERVIHFGLGESSKVKNLELVWPDGNVTSIANPKVDKLHQIVYEKADKKPYSYAVNSNQLFAACDNFNHTHLENKFDDFAVQLLLPYQPSKLGPFMSTTDVNGDGSEDLFIGGSQGQAGSLYTNNGGKLTKQPNAALDRDSQYEDMGSVWFDIESDGDKDLYVASGGYEFNVNDAKLQDRVYINDGKGNLTIANNVVPKIRQSTMAVVAGDFDGDGKTDIASFGRIVPGAYPKSPDSYLLINKEGKLIDKTGIIAPDMKSLGMITDAIATDYDKDGDVDILLVGEWTKVLALENTGGKLTLKTLNGITDSGLYTHINVADLDDDGDLDLLVGNIGKNIKWKASAKKPFKLYADDFDKNGGYDIVLANFSDDELVPVRGRQCSSEQLPYIEKKFETFEEFATAPLDKIYDLEKAQNLEATDFSSAVYINDNGVYTKYKLDNMAQTAPINASIIKDINDDGHVDIIAVGNQFAMEVETTRLDAGSGLVLLGDGTGNFEYVANYKSGLQARKNAKDMVMIDGMIVVSNNDDKAQCFELVK